MDGHEIPRNVRADFCDNPTLSPIEFTRNSSLIALNPARGLNMSYEKICMEDEVNGEMRCPFNQKVKTSESQLLDTKFIGNDWSFEFSCDDTEFEQLSNEPSPVFVDSFSEVRISIGDK